MQKEKKASDHLDDVSCGFCLLFAHYWTRIEDSGLKRGGGELSSSVPWQGNFNNPNFLFPIPAWGNSSRFNFRNKIRFQSYGVTATDIRRYIYFPVFFCHLLCINAIDGFASVVGFILCDKFCRIEYRYKFLFLD